MEVLLAVIIVYYVLFGGSMFIIGILEAINVEGINEVIIHTNEYGDAFIN